jgi:hypothetical protein
MDVIWAEGNLLASKVYAGEFKKYLFPQLDSGFIAPFSH